MMAVVKPEFVGAYPFTHLFLLPKLALSAVCWPSISMAAVGERDTNSYPSSRQLCGI